MDSNDISTFKQYVKERLESLIKTLAYASIGDFSHDVVIPKDEDEFTQLYVGVQVMLEVIREKIAEQKKLTLELERRVEEKTAFLNSIGDGVIATDDKGIVTVINQHAESMLGQTVNDLVGKPLDEGFAVQDEAGNLIPSEKRPLHLALTLGQTIVQKVYIIRKDKASFFARVTATPVFIEGRIVGAIKVMHDVTKEKEIDRMRSEFMSYAAHQLRTPLNSIRWNMEMIRSGKMGVVPEYLKEKLDIVYENDLKMIALVGDLLNISRIDQGRTEGDPRLTNITEIITKVIDGIRDTAGRKQVTLELYTTKYPIPRLLLDPNHFAEIMQNLLDNAIKYTRPGGKVTVSIERAYEYLQIIVKDTGIGIPPAEHPKIFNKFFRASNAIATGVEGTGLGLSMVQSFIKSWNGTINFTSEEGKGTTFSITLPL